MDYRENLKLPTSCSFPLLGFDWLDWGEPYYKAWHNGIDLGTVGATDLGNLVINLKHGFVEFINESLINSAGYGRFVIIHHDDNTFTRYAHLKKITCKQGKEIKDCDIIGEVGGSGYKENSYSPHLHFEVFEEKMAKIQVNHWRKWRFFPNGKDKKWVNENYINPWEWLKSIAGNSTETKKLIKWMKESKLIEQGWENPDQPMSQIRVAHVVRKLYNLLKK